MSSLDSQDEEKEQEAVARVLSRFKPKEVRRREPTNQWRRRTIPQDTNKDLLIERLRWINLLTNQAPSSSSSSTPTQKNHKNPSFISLIPPPPPPKSSKMFSLRTNLQHHKSSQEAKPDTEMIITKSFPLPMVDHKAKLNESSNGLSKQLPFSDKGRYNLVRGCSLNSNRLAPAVQMRSVIPVFATPPSKPNLNLKPSSVHVSTSINSCSAPNTPGMGGQEKKSLSCEMIKLDLESKVLDQTHE